jgi:hypothetical protein
MLSLLRFFFHLSEYCDTQHDTIGVIGCDNLLLINKVIGYQSPFPTAALLDNDWTPFDSLPTLLSNTFPSATLAPDWDVLNESRHSLQDLSFRPTFQHIKGHHHNTPYHNLPLLAQLNVDADTAAGNFQLQHGCHRPHVPLLPHAGAQLQIDDATITYKYKSFIRNAAHRPPLLQYIQQRNQWTPAIVIQYIDWDAHGLAIRRLFHHHVHLTKLIHDLLPTNNDNESQWKPNRIKKCPSCPHPREDRDHVLRHPNLARAD